MELNEELIGNFCYLTQDNELGESPDVHCSIADVIDLLETVYNQAIQDASENAEADIESLDGELTEVLSKLQCGIDYEIPIIRHSILKLKK